MSFMVSLNEGIDLLLRTILNKYNNVVSLHNRKVLHVLVIEVGRFRYFSSTKHFADFSRRLTTILFINFVN